LLVDSKQRARQIVREMLNQLRTLLSENPKAKLSESDTKVYFVDPLLSALGFSGLQDIRREYYIKDSREFIDYMLYIHEAPIMAVEAKQLQHDLDARDAAQLVQYAAIEGIEWCALINGARLQLYNAYLKAPLAGKLVADFDLLAFNTDAEFDALFDDLWLLSKESLATPAGIKAWMNQRRLDTAIRSVLSLPDSQSVLAVQDELARADIDASAETIVQWFRSRLLTASAILPSNDEYQVSLDVAPVIESVPVPNAKQSADNAISLQDLIRSGLITPPMQIEVTYKDRQLTARIQANGTVNFQGQSYTSLSKAGGSAKNVVMGRTIATNGWEFWQFIDSDGQRRYIDELRRRYAQARTR